MVIRNKLYRIIEKYRSLLKIRKYKNGRLKIGNRSKNLVLDFYLKNNRWPSRLSPNKREKRLAQRFENYISKESLSFDPNFRRIAMVTGRTTNNKRKHDIEGFKREILEFIKDNGRAPIRYSAEVIEGEGNLRSKLDRYTLTLKDMTFLGKIYELDRCHRSGIPYRFRAIINEALDVEKPLIRLI
jgi:hypothetical protein